jgi:MHS family proline/betaine transporter-like MFS transporter
LKFLDRERYCCNPNTEGESFMSTVAQEIDAEATAGKKTRVLAAGFIGNILEWYDFAVYGFFAPTIGKLFFPAADARTSLIAAFGAFAAG